MSALLDVVVPPIGEVSEVVVARICVAAGDVVEDGALLAELESDKADVEVKATERARVHRVAVAKGDVLKIGAVIVQLVRVG